MSRGLNNAQKLAAAGSHREIVPLLEMHFDGGLLAMALAPWPVQSGATTYVKTGPLLSIKGMTESANSFEGLEFSMSGLDASIKGIAAQEQYRGRVVKLLKAYVEVGTGQIVGTPVVQFIGRIRAMPIRENNETCDVVCQAEHYEAELQRPFPLRLNNSDQQRLCPGDKGAEYVESLVDKNVIWPTREAQMK